MDQRMRMQAQRQTALALDQIVDIPAATALKTK
jgi:hypothetical protein